MSSQRNAQHILTRESDENYTPNTPEQPVINLVLKVFDGVIDLDLCSAGLMSVPRIAQEFQAYLEKKLKKDASIVSIHDIQAFVADKIWEAKLKNDAILNPALTSTSSNKKIASQTNGFPTAQQQELNIED